MLRHVRLAQVPSRNGKLSDDDVEQAAKQYRAGETLKSIAKDLAVHSGTIRAALVKAGVEIQVTKPPAKQPKLDDAAAEDCRRRFQAGETLTDLASEYGVVRGTIRRSIDR